MPSRPLANHVSKIQDSERINELEKRIEDLEILVNHLMVRKKTIERQYLQLKEKLEEKSQDK